MNDNLPRYIIRPFESVADHEQCQTLQSEVWGPTFAVPVNMTVAVEHHGGVAIGAFDSETGQLLGFTLSFVAPTRFPQARGGLSHHSHMAAVIEGLRGRGLGAQLKLAQREAVLARGFNLITWTYDPLEARNATLNIRKLGCICRTYERNLYGDMADNLNAGLPTDRFEVECWLDKRCPQFEPGGATREIEIPTDFQSVKRSDLRQALAWRAHTRAQFEQAFADGFAVRAFTNRSDRAWYTLTRLSANLAII